MGTEYPKMVRRFNTSTEQIDRRAVETIEEEQQALRDGWKLRHRDAKPPLWWKVKRALVGFLTHKSVGKATLAIISAAVGAIVTVLMTKHC